MPDEKANQNADTPSIRGRRVDPRLAQTREIVLSACIRLLLDEGLRRVTAARVHQVTGVARTTIYRHWPTQTDLIVATLDRLTVPGRPVESNGDFEADLRELLTQLKRRMEQRRVRELVSATLAMSMENADHAQLPQRFLDGLLAPIREKVAMETARIDTDEGASARLYDRIVGPLLFRHVLMLGSIQPEQIDELVRHAVSALERLRAEAETPTA